MGNENIKVNDTLGNILKQFVVGNCNAYLFAGAVGERHGAAHILFVSQYHGIEVNMQVNGSVKTRQRSLFSEFYGLGSAIELISLDEFHCLLIPLTADAGLL